jgi:hypothetical protein
VDIQTLIIFLTNKPVTENFRGEKSTCLAKYLVLFEELAAISIPKL